MQHIRAICSLQTEANKPILRHMHPLPPPPGSVVRASHAPHPGQRGKTPKFDDFQQAVIDCNEKVIVAKAFAGAGKTTTAIGFSNARPQGKFLYICLNKANQMEASVRFGPHVECRTSHSLAYAAVGHKFKEQLVNSWKPRAFASELKIADTRLAAAVQATLTQFFCSRDTSIEEIHSLGSQDQFALGPVETANVIALSRLAWGRMQTPGSGLSIPHDAYLKMWALKRPKLEKYSHIILDEAQDTNPVTASIVECQSHATRLLIGDPHQSIYLFRGAVNAMEQFSNMGAKVLDMPKTWRFGPDIATIANSLLSFFKFETTPIIGAGPTSKRSIGAARAVLSRTNVGLFAEAAAVMGKNTHWVGGIESARLDMLQSAYNLYRGQPGIVTDPVLASYRSWSEYESDASASQDTEARMLIKMVGEYKHDLPKILNSLRANALPTQEGARLVLSTAHKAKGLDWEQVTLGEDFSCIKECLNARMSMPHERMAPEQEQEINLLYVAITRARHAIDLNKETKEFINRFPMHVNGLVEASAALTSNFEIQSTVPVGC